MPTRLQQFVFFIVLIVATLQSNPMHGQSIQWIIQDSADVRTAYRRIAYFDSAHILALGGSTNTYSLARVTLDAGRTWQTTFRDSLDLLSGEKSVIRLWDAMYIDSLTILMTADSGNIYKSIDGGLHWSRIQTSITYKLISISMRDRGLGVCCGALNNLLITRDAGESWKKLELPQEAIIEGLYLTDADFAKDSTLIISMAWANVCRRYLSTDLGQSWVVNEQPCLVPRMVRGPGNSLWSMGGIYTGYREYRRDILEVSDDGGRRWRTILNDSIDPAGGLNDVAFADDQHGVAVGVSGKVLITNDGGETWNNESIPFTWTINIMGVIYPTPRQVWAVTVLGDILKGVRLNTGVGLIREIEENLSHPVVRRGEDYQLQLYFPNLAMPDISVVDVLGREMLRLDNVNVSSGVHIIPLQTSRLPTGWYYIEIHSETQRAGIPLIVH